MDHHAVRTLDLAKARRHQERHNPMELAPPSHNRAAAGANPGLVPAVEVATAVNMTSDREGFPILMGRVRQMILISGYGRFKPCSETIVSPRPAAPERSSPA